MAQKPNRVGQKIVDSTLNVLRDQEDLRQKQINEGDIKFNPASFGVAAVSDYIKRAFLEDNKGGEKRYLVLGPYRFKRRFAEPPKVAFGSVQQEIKDLNSIGLIPGQPSNYLPFIVHPDVLSFTYSNGEVDGFYVGLYAVTRPPSGVLQHTINWIAVGKASRYDDTQSKQAWSKSFDHNNTPDFLVNDVSQIRE